MRKWMSERLKRRKKAANGNTKESAKAVEPLQPKYYDDELAPKAEIDVPEVEDLPKSTLKAETVPVAEPTQPASAPAPASQGAAARTRPSRRRRGGRGGSRPRTDAVQSPVAATPPPDQESAVPEGGVGETPVQVAPAPVRGSKGTVVLAIGLPGSGKSSWFKRHNIRPLSSDLLRELLFDNAEEQRFQDLVFSNLRSMLKARLIARRPLNYVDATNLTPHDRHSWIKLARDYGYDVQGVFFDVPLEVCMERHQRRGRVVPEDIMRKMAGKLKAPTFEEGFSKITVVRVKQKEAAAN